MSYQTQLSGRVKLKVMKNIILPTVDNDVKLISHGTTMIIERNHSSVEEYAITCIPGTRTIDWSGEEVKEKISNLLDKGWEYAK